MKTSIKCKYCRARTAKFIDEYNTPICYFCKKIAREIKA